MKKLLIILMLFLSCRGMQMSDNKNNVVLNLNYLSECLTDANVLKKTFLAMLGDFKLSHELKIEVLNFDQPFFSFSAYRTNLKIYYKYGSIEKTIETYTETDLHMWRVMSIKYRRCNDAHLAYVENFSKFIKVLKSK